MGVTGPIVVLVSLDRQIIAQKWSLKHSPTCVCGCFSWLRMFHITKAYQRLFGIARHRLKESAEAAAAALVQGAAVGKLYLTIAEAGGTFTFASEGEALKTTPCRYIRAGRSPPLPPPPLQAHSVGTLL